MDINCYLQDFLQAIGFLDGELLWEYYHDQWIKARLTEGASQRVQEDTLKFARIMEGLGTGLLDSVMTLIVLLQFYGAYQNK